MTNPEAPQWPGYPPPAAPAYPPTASPVPPPGYKAFGYPDQAEAPPVPPPPPAWPAQAWPAQAGYAAPGWAPVPPPKRRRGRAALGIVVALVSLAFMRLALGEGFDFVAGQTRDPLHTPEQIGTSPRMTSEFAREVESDMKADMDSSQKPQAGVYGRNGRPQYALLAGYGFEENGKQVLDGFADESSDGVTVGKPKTMTGGIVCASVVDQGSRGAVCAWAGDRSDGLLWAFTKPDLSALAKLTGTARAEVEGPVTRS